MKKLILFSLVTIFLVACNSEAAIEKENETIELYNKNCAGCHHLQLTGTELGSAILGLTKDEVLKSIIEGDEGMEANILVGEDAERVAAWVAKQK